MTNEKLIDVFTFYRAQTQVAFPDIVAERCDVTKHPSDGELVGHLLWCCEEGVKFVKEERFEKAMRWLGFVQGVLCARKVFTIAELGAHSKPPEPPYTTEYVSEVAATVRRRARTLDTEGSEIIKHCSHKNAAGESRLRGDGTGSGDSQCLTCGACVA